ncbi:response regulator transcription factor [Acanthopleuribacter pedis]|uniref:Response regulator transcription factor n=1 Tax=Acanthopleuribacter pedis TaxID=442870 RepID=A0A8J7QD91_9BACT|nr:response regulator transcription factor [Acanthopleuribacter pedis]MBO1317465.1 response regulator transcription factor [Acanthopleuribacter pedis]
MHLLLVEDNEGVADLVQRGFDDLGYRLTWLEDGRELIATLRRDPADLVILDVMLPGKNGFELLEDMRTHELAVPVLFLSAKTELEDRVRGLDLGADDYLTKPFAFTELHARVKALLRRSQSNSRPASTLVVGPLTLDLHERRAMREGQEIALQNKEFELLRFLMQHAGEIVSKRMIIEEVWNYTFNPGTNIVEVRIAALRDKVDRPFAKSMIKTVRGAGYRLNPDV